MQKKKPGPKNIAKNKLRKHLHCTIDPTILREFKKVVKNEDYRSTSEAVDKALAEFTELHA
jgi:metal-responsive CopG/Arc/MetJ family transcriptional regulator